MGMMVRNFGLFWFMVATLAVTPGDSALCASKAPTAPGQYRDWDDDIDEVTIIQPFRLDSYSDIAVESFDVTRVTLPDPNENTHLAVRAALTSIKPAFLEGFQKELRQRPGGSGADRGKSQTLVVIVRVTKLDPGSQAARYWAGFGAGAVKIEVTGDVVDARSRKVLVRFKQERRSGFGVFGGGYGELFNRTARQIGGDVANLLNAF
jgi:Domain of unknown function (DUF4410)